MPLGSALSKLKQDLAAAFDESVAGGIEDIGKESIIDKLADQFSSSVDSYSKEGQIDTVVTVLPGSIIAVPAGPNAAPVPGTGVGKITGMAVADLKSKLVSAFEKSTDAGSQDGASSSEVNTDLGKDIAQAVLDYYNSAVVETEIELQTFLTMGVPPITPAAIAPGEKGTGTGTGGAAFGLTGLSASLANLSSDVSVAFDDKVSQSSESGVSTSDVNSSLGSSLGQAIHDFVTLSIVKTNCTFQGGTGEAAPTSLMPAPPGPPVPTAPPPKTVPGAIGTGLGQIS